MPTVPTFTLARTPAVRFGRGEAERLPDLLAMYCGPVLLVTGAGSFAASGRLDRMVAALAGRRVHAEHLAVAGEPTPELVDEAVSRHRGNGIAAVCAIGGGSVLDAGKAVAAMLPVDGSVYPYLEGVDGGTVHDGRTLPLVAVPTTAGTGSEATKNAVLSRVGRDGFKCSLRHDNFVPALAVIDPELALTCPPAVTAASGLDAITQLLEAYVSTAASPVTDALAECGLAAAREGFVPACTTGAGDSDVRADMALAAFLSGVCLASAGLGVVHGFASSVGGMVDIPHGVLCGTLLAAATRTIVVRLREQDTPGAAASLDKHARAGVILAGHDRGSVSANCGLLIEMLSGWIDRFGLPRLGAYGFTAADIDAAVHATGRKNTPVPLSDDDLRAILLDRM